MPVCICPNCSKSHKIPAKNLGLKGRCTQCRTIFTLVEHKDDPLGAPAPVFVPPHPPAAQNPVPDIEPNTFSLRLPVPPTPTAVPTFDPEISEDEGDEFEWVDSVSEPDDDSKRNSSRRVAIVAKLENRPALIAISQVFRVMGILCFMGASLVFSMCLFSLAMTKMEMWIGAVILFVPSIVGCIISGVMMFAIRELIQMARSMEERLHEISKNVSQ